MPALPDPVNHTRIDDEAEPEGLVEELIAAVWTDVLSMDRVRLDDDFFALGGHSLAALRVAARVCKQLGVTLSTRDIYRLPRLRDLAGHVARLAMAKDGSHGP